MDYKLLWKSRVDSVALKIGKTIGLLSKLRHFVPHHTLANIYNSLIIPYLHYGLTVWGQASKTHLNKLLILQKCALRFMYFSDRISLTASYKARWPSRKVPISSMKSAMSWTQNVSYYESLRQQLLHGYSMLLNQSGGEHSATPGTFCVSRSSNEK